MKTGLTWITTALVASAMALSACGKGSSESAEGGDATSGGEPVDVSVADQAEWDSLVASGGESFENACGTCHPGGEADLGPALKGEKTKSAKMVRQIREGSGKMAPIGTDKLPEAEMKGLLVYLASIDAVGDIKAP